MKSLRLFLPLLLAIVLPLGLAGCGGNSEIDTATTEGSDTTPPTTAEKQKVMLQVSTFGKGKISVDTGSDQLTCSSSEGLCEFRLEKGTEVTLTAVTKNPDYEFRAWDTCDVVTKDSTCKVTLNGNTLAAATFAMKGPLKVHETVVELTERQIRNIAYYASDSNFITFKAGTSLSGIRTGSIIVSNGYTSSNPDDKNSTVYFARRVRSITGKNAGTPIVVNAVPVTLTHVIDNGTLSADWDTTISLEGEGSELRSSMRTVTYSPNGAPRPRIRFRESFHEEFGPITLDGSMFLYNDIDFDVSWDERDFWFDDLVSVRFMDTFITRGDLSVTVEGEVSDDFREILVERSLPVIQASVVTLVPTLRVSIVGSAHASASTGASAFQRFKIWGGVTYYDNREDSFDAFSGKESEGDIEFSRIVAELGAELSLEVSLTIEIWDIAGPSAALRPGIGFQALGFVPPKDGCISSWNLYAQLEGDIGFEFHALTLDLVYREQLFDLEFPIVGKPCTRDTEKPTIPGNLTATLVPTEQIIIDPYNIKVTWDKSTDNIQLSHYQVSILSVDGSNKAVRKIKVSDAPFIDTTVVPGTRYCYYLKAVDTSGNETIMVGRKCQEVPEAVLIPPVAELAPEGLRTSRRTTSGTTVTWDQSGKEDDVAGYVIQTMLPGGEYVPVARVDGDTLSFSNVGLAADTQYCYRVAAVTASGKTSPVSAATCTKTLPPAQAAYTMYLACQGQEYQLEQKLDLNLDVTSSVDVAGVGKDYYGAPLSYVLHGAYNADTGMVKGRLFWTFKGQERQRIDEFAINLSDGDSGNVSMTVVQKPAPAACPAIIRIARNGDGGDTPPPAARGATRPSTPSLSLGGS